MAGISRSPGSPPTMSPSRRSVINAETGEVEARDRTNTVAHGQRSRRPDPVLLAVQTVLAKGSVVAPDRASRAPPLDAPVKAELFGERAETRSGAARRQQRFSVSLFDEDVARRLEARKGAKSDRLAACSLMLREGVRWVPDSANDLLRAEFDVGRAGSPSRLASRDRRAKTRRLRRRPSGKDKEGLRRTRGDDCPRPGAAPPGLVEERSRPI